MTCCGQRRPQTAAGAMPPPAPARLDAVSTVTLRSARPAPITVVGPVTGRRYGFTAGAALAVDSRDAPRLLASRLFRRG